MKENEDFLIFKNEDSPMGFYVVLLNEPFKDMAVSFTNLRLLDKIDEDGLFTFDYIMNPHQRKWIDDHNLITDFDTTLAEVFKSIVTSVNEIDINSLRKS